MDLEERARTFFDAMRDVQIDRLLELFADDGIYDVLGVVGPMDKEQYEAYLRAVKHRMPKVSFTIEAIAVRRNITFVEWRSQGQLALGQPIAYHGVHVLSWNQDGRIAHASVHTQREAIEPLVQPRGAAPSDGQSRHP